MTIDSSGSPSDRLGRRRRRRSVKSTLAEVFVILTILTLIVLILLPSWDRWRDSQVGRTRCGSNLRQIGQAILVYSMEHSGRRPASIEDLLCADITPAVFVCPYADDSVARTGPTTRATAANVTSGGHLSYVILFDAIDKEPAVDVVVAYEPLSNHQGAGTNVLYADGHVDFQPVPQATRLIAELSTGHNPPRPLVSSPSPSTTPTTIPQ
jgi:prepilin-type processing-associated H-X9-DG protein